jgi:hypothetical protein
MSSAFGSISSLFEMPPDAQHWRCSGRHNLSLDLLAQIDRQVASRHYAARATNQSLLAYDFYNHAAYFVVPGF